MFRLWFASLTLLVAGIACGAEPAKPHVVLILADDLGWKDVGYHGSEITTPHLDKLAGEGLRLEQFYVQPVCSPTRSSLMTGRYPIRQGLQVGVIRPWADYGLDLSERMLSVALKEAGYATAICGKWHLGAHAREYLPHRRGFDHEYGHYLGAIDYFTHRRNGGLDWHRNGKALQEKGYSTNLIGREAVKVIEGHDAKRPLFLYVPFNSPHTPLQAPPKYLEKYAGIKEMKRRKYAAMVTCMDDNIGRIVAALDARKMRSNTLILFASDNGGPTRLGANNGELRGSKGTLYEGGVRVPALAVWPGKLKAGGEVRELMHIVDWHATLLKLADAQGAEPSKLDGYDVWPTLAEGKPTSRKEILHNHIPTSSAIRVGNWKLITRTAGNGARRRRGPPLELFNIASDPNEKSNVAEKHPDIVHKLRGRLREYAEAAVKPKNTGGRMPKGFKVPKVWGEPDGGTLDDK